MLLVGFRYLQNVYPTHTHTTSAQLRLTERRPKPNFMAKNGALLSLSSPSPVTTSPLRCVAIAVAQRSNVALLHCYFILFCPWPTLRHNVPPTLHTLTNLQRLTYLTCWHALNRMSDVGQGTAATTLQQSKKYIATICCGKTRGRWRMAQNDRRTWNRQKAGSNCRCNEGNPWKPISYFTQFNTYKI